MRAKLGEWFFSTVTGISFKSEIRWYQAFRIYSTLKNLPYLGNHSIWDGKRKNVWMEKICLGIQRGVGYKKLRNHLCVSFEISYEMRKRGFTKIFDSLIWILDIVIKYLTSIARLDRYFGTLVKCKLVWVEVAYLVRMANLYRPLNNAWKWFIVSYYILVIEKKI